MRWQVRHYQHVVETHGTESERQEFSRLHGQYEKYAEADDARGFTWVRDQMWNLHCSVVRDQMWYWQNWLATLKLPSQRFLNAQQASEVLADGDAANSRNDMPARATFGGRGGCRPPIKWKPRRTGGTVWPEGPVREIPHSRVCLSSVKRFA